MLARIFSLVAASSLLLLAAAAPGGKETGGHNDVSQCNNGEIYCCNQTQEAESVDKRTSLILELVGVDASNLQGVVGSNCSPLTAIGVGSGGSCSTQQVCCQKNFNNGLVVIGCSPIDISV
ncbi:hypothetical protein EST38_g5797 [Candolleomyces aberdarensis]|uniref:Hydrophobin n=1 Tax=Candolleomyces aberdarensis TaxID=2316362 RepID=A0A4Q2DJL4_9AGAR|nr:hypothetical protein EST38_g5797 [Candolleomyces aberdarensis]